jgi:hypothetical protein
MSKSRPKLYRALTLLTLVLAFAGAADAKPSFKSGFSSRSSSSSLSSSSSHSSSFPSSSSSSKSGGFGSFSRSASAPPQKADSALSQQLSKQQSEANALRTLDARRAAAATPAPAPANAMPANAAPPPPAAPYGAPMQAPGQTVVVHQDSGFGNLITGYLFGRMASGHSGYHNGGYNNGGYANDGSYPNGGPGYNSAPQSGGSFFGSLLRMIVWIAILAALTWLVVKIVKRVRVRRDADKPNYSFERNH